MSRSLIGVIVAFVIAALTTTAYFVTTSRLNEDIRKDTDARVARARGTLQRTAQLEGLGILKKAEVLAADPGLLRALKADNPGDRIRESNLAFGRFKADQGDTVPDILAVVDATGDIMAMDGISSPSPTEWKKGGQKTGDMLFAGLDLTLKKRVIISEIWNFAGKGLMRVGVAPIIDVEAQVPATAASDDSGVVIIGAVVAAYSLTSDEARKQEQLLGADVAYYDGKQVFATSFKRDGKAEEDTDMQKLLSGALTDSGLDKPGTTTSVSLDGRTYLAASIQLARFSTKPLPATYPAATAGAVVLMAPSEQGERVGIVKLFVLVLGLGSLAVALFGMYMTNHRILVQVDHVELGVAEIINGNLDRTFRPVGDELEGLSNGLNVMLARLLGRPEPGDEEFDEDGNQIIPGRVEFEEAEEGDKPAVDPDLSALAQEPEPDYYKRVFTEYVDGRKQVGHPDEVSFENFIAKLRVNEGKLRATYNCKAVRFRVVVKDGKVTLKPVPIFA
jgi:hypothetical protein